ncbi:MAG: hypothetical protein WCY78_04980 [Sphaerochaetaceae bacterium]
MTDIEQLMQNSEAMRMLKLGNPERSKDFNLPKMPIGLFDIERMVEEPLRNMIQNSKDPNGAIDKFDTALMLNNLGIDMDTAFSMANMGFSSSVTGIDTRDKNYWNALKTKAQHTHWNDMKGLNISLYQMTGNKWFRDKADEYNSKIMNNPVFNTYGVFGDLVLDSVQPTLSAIKFLATTALLSWIPGGIASAVWSPAIGNLVTVTGVLAANAVNWFTAGYSQAGDVLYNVMQMEDAEGNTLPWDSLAAGALYHGLAGLMGLVELGSMEMFPWYRHLKNMFTGKELLKHMERGFLAATKNFLWEGTKGTASEALEEGIQTALGIGFENALMAMANKEGANFELTSIKDTTLEAGKAVYEAGKSMLLTSFLTAGIGQSAYSLRLRAEAKKNFTPTANSVAVDSGLIGVPKTAVEAMEDGVAVGSMQPVKVVNVGDHLVPIDDVELKKAARAVKNGLGAMEVIVVGFPSIDTSDFTAMLHRAAIATEGKIINDSELGFETQEDLDRAMFLLALNVEAIEQNEKGTSIVIRNEDGDITKLQLSLIKEGQNYAEPDLSYIDDIQAPYSLATMAKDRALEWHERNIIKEAIGDLVTHTKGRLSSVDLEANIDAVKLVADALKIPTDQMLKENLVFKLEKGTIKGERGYIENVTVDGKKQYTIHLSDKADATTLLHELGHFIRGTASKEQLVDFTQYYGKGAEAVWIEDINKVGDKYHVGEQIFDSFDEAKRLIEANEEAFADDFVAYLRTGQAPTSGLRNIFQRLKAVLSRFVKEFGYNLNPFVKNAFDRLLAGDLQVNEIDLTSSNAQMANQKLYQLNSDYKAVVNRYKDTEVWMKAPNGNPTNLTERQWVMVRTPAFKRWFGDWEAAENLKWLLSGKPIVQLVGDEFRTNLVDSVSAFYNKIGNRVERPGMGEVTLTRHDIQASVGHGIGRNKAIAFAAVPDVIRQGREFSRTDNYKNRGYTSVVIAAPISIKGVEYICEVVINQRVNSNNFYLHEVEIKEKLQLGNQVRNYMDEHHPNRNTKAGASRLIISKLLAEGKFESSVIQDKRTKVAQALNLCDL